MTIDDAGLPTPAEVRCLLAIDIGLQVHGLFELAGLRGMDDVAYARSVRQTRDARLVQRLQDVLPPDEFSRMFSAGRVDLAELADRVPAAHPILVMTTAVALEEAAGVVEARAAKSD